MKDPRKDVIEVSDTVIIGIPYRAEKGIDCQNCDLKDRLKDKDFEGCSSINCRHIIYKKAKGGI